MTERILQQVLDTTEDERAVGQEMAIFFRHPAIIIGIFYSSLIIVFSIPVKVIAFVARLRLQAMQFVGKLPHHGGVFWAPYTLFFSHGSFSRSNNSHSGSWRSSTAPACPSASE